MNIENEDFYLIVDKLIRDHMKKAEVTLLSTAKQALKDVNIPLEKYTPQGYYGESKELTEYYQHIKTLQENSSKIVTKNIERLHMFYSSPAFGLKQALANELNSTDVWNPNRKSIISPVLDQLGLAVLYTDKKGKEFSIPNICDEMKNITFGKNLAGLASLVDGKTDYSNPTCTVIGRETTVLSAYVPLLTGTMMNYYSVDKDVEYQGNLVINTYNKAFRSVGININIPNVNKNNAFELEGTEIKDMEVTLATIPSRTYNWAIKRNKVVDYWK